MNENTQITMNSQEKSRECVNDKLLESMKIIENLSKILGVKERDKITFDIDEISENEIRIRVKNGELDYKSPWFCIKNEEPYVFMPAQILDVIVKMLKNAQRESFELKLEKTIWQSLPVDFGDVWRVAMGELAKHNYKKEPDLTKIVDKIKREHPNLFVDVTSLVETRREDD